MSLTEEEAAEVDAVVQKFNAAAGEASIASVLTALSFLLGSTIGLTAATAEYLRQGLDISNRQVERHAKEAFEERYRTANEH